MLPLRRYLTGIAIAVASTLYMTRVGEGAALVDAGLSATSALRGERALLGSRAADDNTYDQGLLPRELRGGRRGGRGRGGGGRGDRGDGDKQNGKSKGNSGNNGCTMLNKKELRTFLTETESTCTLKCAPTFSPSATPTEHPTHDPTATPSAKPTNMPTSEPTMLPTFKPTKSPTTTPTDSPTSEAPTTAAPTSAAPTTGTPTSAAPTTAVPETEAPTVATTEAPSAASTEAPTTSVVAPPEDDGSLTPGERRALSEYPDWLKWYQRSKGNRKESKHCEKRTKKELFSNEKDKCYTKCADSIDTGIGKKGRGRIKGQIRKCTALCIKDSIPTDAQLDAAFEAAGCVPSQCTLACLEEQYNAFLASLGCAGN